MPANDPALPAADDEYEPDPVFVDSLNEAGWILLMWLGCFVWTLSVCLTFGYQRDVQPATFKTVLGIPSWVAYGIGLPWLLADIVTIWFCIFRMKDGDLGEEANAVSAAGDSSDA